MHHLTRHAKVNKNLTFTNTLDEDLDVLYAVIEHDEDDVGLTQTNARLTGMDGENKDNTSNEDYDPEQSNNGYSEVKEDNESNDNNDNGDDAPETEVFV